MNEEYLKSQLDDIICDLMIKHGPDRHIDGHEEIAEGVFNWMKEHIKDMNHD